MHHVTAATECAMGPHACTVVFNQRCAGRLQLPLTPAGPPPGPPTSSSVPPLRSTLVDWARQRGLVVHAWSFRNEDPFLPLDVHGDPAAELQLYGSLDQGLGVDGIFVDCPSTAMQWKKSLPPPTPHVNTLQAQVIPEIHQDKQDFTCVLCAQPSQK